MAEHKALIEFGCFEVVDEKFADGNRIYRHSFAEKIKANGDMKSRICLAAFNDK